LAGRNVRLFFAQEAAGIGIWEYDISSQALSWSHEQYCLHGLDPAAGPPTFEQWLNLIEPDDRSLIRDAEVAVRGPGAGSLGMEFHIRRGSDGARRKLASLGRLVRDGDGRPSRIVGVNLDITERRQSEEDLRRTMALLRAIGNCSPDLIYAKDAEGRLLFANPAILAMLGKTADEVIGRTDADWHHDPQQAAAVMANDRRIMETGCAEVVEETFDAAGLGTRVFRSAKATLRMEDGTPVGVVAVSSDITQARAADAALRKSEARFRAIFEQAAVGMAEADLDGRLIRVNDRLCGMLGYTRDEMLAVTFREVTHPDDLAMDLAHLQRLLAGEVETFVMEKRYIHKNGSHIWAALTVSLVRDQTGAPEYLIGVIEDISERKLAEAALRESEQRFRALFDGAPLPGYLVDPNDASIVDCNEAAAAMLGYERDALRRMRVPDIDAVMQGDHLASARLVLTGLSAQFETQHRTRSGEVRDVAITAVPVDIAGHRLAHTTVVDITDRKRAEARFRATFDHAAVGIAHIAPDGRFMRVNQRICDGFGYTREELLRRSVHELVDPEQRDEVLSRLRCVACGEADSYTGDRRYIAADGRALEVSVTVSMVHDRAEPPYFLVVAQDISDRKQAEAELRNMAAELEARVCDEVAARETAQARAAQAERLQALGQLAGGIAHDFNNVLQAVQGSASLITLRAADPVAVQRYARIVMDATDRGASITRRLLTFARRGDLRAEAIEVPAVLDGMRDILAPTLGAAITIRVNAEPGLPRLLADRGQLETAIVNLATNARDAMPRGGTLTLSATMATVVPGTRHRANLVPGRYVAVVVSDIGTGMDEATLARAFQPFFTTKTHGRGTGLGLAMVKGFAEQSGGGVTIDSAPGQGTTVIVWLPLAASEGFGAGGPDGREGGDALTVEPCRPRILVVDDDQLVLETLAAQLEEEGFAVSTAGDGAHALALLEKGLGIDALVSDLSMPGMDGVSLILAAQARQPSLPALLLTGYAGDGVSLALGDRINGPFGLLRKPIQGSELADQISALLQKDANAGR
jgi:PAS domain S-box-containing protein